MRSKIKFYIFLATAFSLLCFNVFAQDKSPLKVQVSGTGKQAIIFIPGFGCSGDVWKETLPMFEKNYKCYTLTMPGIAGNPVATPITMNNWVAIVASYIEKNKIDKPIIIGHSMGGGMSLLLAAAHPALVSKIVVVDALPCLGAVMNKDYKAKTDNDCSPIVKMFTGMTDEQFRQMEDRNMRQLCADTTRIPNVVNWAATSDRTTLGEIYCDFINTDMRDKISTIQCPALILLEPSFASMKDGINDQYKNLKTAQLHYATKGLHFIMYDDFEWYGKELKAFIK